MKIRQVVIIICHAMAVAGCKSMPSGESGFLLDSEFIYSAEDVSFPKNNGNIIKARIDIYGIFTWQKLITIKIADEKNSISHSVSQLLTFSTLGVNGQISITGIIQTRKVKKCLEFQLPSREPQQGLYRTWMVFIQSMWRMKRLPWTFPT